LYEPGAGSFVFFGLMLAGSRDFDLPPGSFTGWYSLADGTFASMDAYEDIYRIDLRNFIYIWSLVSEGQWTWLRWWKRLSENFILHKAIKLQALGAHRFRAQAVVVSSVLEFGRSKCSFSSLGIYPWCFCSNREC
jgi:hypothetical protein